VRRSPDFKSAEDRIQFASEIFTSFSDMVIPAAHSASNIIVADAIGDTLQGNNMLDALRSADFLFG
jgi:hypothetical protein